VVGVLGRLAHATLNLARALMRRADLLLLDEPTNQPRPRRGVWLEDWLKRFRGAVVFITHDREFLDAVAQQMCMSRTDAERVRRQTTPPSETQRAERLALQQSAYDEAAEDDRAPRGVHQSLPRRKATKAAQAPGRSARSRELERIAAAHVDSPFTFAFRAPEEKPRQLFSLEEVTVGYAANPWWSGIDWSVLPGDAIGTARAERRGQVDAVEVDRG
jgi:ATP-binding cassette subfamily F protein 3